MKAKVVRFRDAVCIPTAGPDKVSTTAQAGQGLVIEYDDTWVKLYFGGDLRRVISVTGNVKDIEPLEEPATGLEKFKK